MPLSRAQIPLTNPLALPDGGSIDTRSNGGGGGSILLSGLGDENFASNGGSIDLRALLNETSNGGSIISQGKDGYSGGTLNLSAGGGHDGGSISSIGGSAGNGGAINLSGGASGAGGTINLSNAGGSITLSNSSGSINLSGYDADYTGGNITATGADGYNAGSLNMSASEDAGGSINTSGGVDGAGGSINLSNGGGSINISGSFGGSFTSVGPDGGSINLSTNGGSINLSGDNSQPNYGGSISASAVDGADGGSINISGGEFGNGGSINLSSGGGSINTQGVGSIQFGVSGTRTTLNGSATADRTATLPNITGTLPIALISASTALNFGNISGSGAFADLTISLTGAVTTDVVFVTCLAGRGATDGQLIFEAFVSATDTVTVRAHNPHNNAINPASYDFKVAIIRI